MTKREIVKRVSDAEGIPIRTVRVVINDLLDIVKETVEDGDDVVLSNFGTFTSKRWQGREIKGAGLITDRRTPRFIPSKKFKVQLNKK